MSVVVQRDDGQHLLICKGAVEELFSISTGYETESECGRSRSHPISKRAKRETAELNADGFRVVAVAYKEMPPDQTVYTVADESDLTLLGYIAFLDPPKESAAAAIATLAKAGVSVKILTGDNDIVTRKICKDVNLKVDRVVLGSDDRAYERRSAIRSSPRPPMSSQNCRRRRKPESSTPCTVRDMSSAISATGSTTVPP